MTREEFVAALAAANAIVPQVTSLITIGAFAIDQLWGIWSERNPGKPFEEFLAELRANAADLKGMAAEQLKARGFVQAPDGAWYRPLPTE